MLDRRTMFAQFLQEDLKDLADCIDQCFETLNMMLLWQAMNGVESEEQSMREDIVSFFSRDFGEEAGVIVANLLLGPVEGD